MSERLLIDGSKVKLDLEDTKSIRISGRYPCDCEATYHLLVSNCLNCGRIICSQEGQGNCFTCGQYVESIKTRRSSQDAKKSSKITDKSKKNLQKAIELKDSLIDKNNCGDIASVLDDQMDYFQVENNFWLKPGQSDYLKEQIANLEIERVQSIDLQERSYHPFYPKNINDLLIEDNITSVNDDFFTKVKKAISECELSNLKNLNNSNSVKECIEYEIYTKNLLQAMKTHDEMFKSINHKKYLRYTLQTSLDFDFKKSENDLQTNDSRYGLCLPQPLANLICLSQLKCLPTYFLQNCEINDNTVYWIVASDLFINDINDFIDMDLSMMIQRMINMNIDNYIKPKHCKLKHIIGRARFIIEKTPIDCKNEKYCYKPNENDRSKVFLLDSFLLDLPIPYDDRNRGIWQIEKEVVDAVLKSIEK